jgi:hypothetical protein
VKDRDSGDTACAEREFRVALASFAGYIPGAEHPLAATVRLDLAHLEATNAHTRAEARRLTTEAVAIREKFLGSDDPRTRSGRISLSKLQMD